MLKYDIISCSQPKSIASEAYRALRTNLDFSMNEKNLKSILITSSHASEGKSSIASNLATVFAMKGKKTILIDADMRRGIQHSKFEVSNSNGLSNFLANLKFDEKGFIRRTDIPNLYLITSGPVPPNPAELISSNRMEDLINQLKEEFDIVIVDGAPVLPVTDSVIISGIIDKVVIVSSHGETHREELKSVVNTLNNVGANIAGVVINKVSMKDKKFNKYGKYGKYYGSYYGSYYSNDSKDSK